MRRASLVLLSIMLGLAATAQAMPAPFSALDVFQLEWVSDPQVSPDGSRIVFVRNFGDITADRWRANLWIINADGGDLRPLTSGLRNDSSPRWSPDGTRLLYASSVEGSSQLYVRWMDTGQTARLANLPETPSGLAWSPDGRQVAFSMLVKDEDQPFVKLPKPPEGAQWARPMVVIDRLLYRADGEGYRPNGYAQLFVLPAEGGTPRQVTGGRYHHEDRPVFTPDGRALVFSANRHDDWEFQPLNSELYEVALEDGAIRALTARNGPDQAPALSPDGRTVAYTGFDDRYQGYQVRQLYLLDRANGDIRVVTAALDRDVEDPVWSADGSRVYFQYDDHGDTHVASVTRDGRVTKLFAGLGGTSLGRPYGGGSFSVARNGHIAYTQSRPDRPADLGVFARGDTRRLTGLNEDLLGQRALGKVEPLELESSFDGRPIEAWLLLPPARPGAAAPPLILEIHGGPFQNYGPRFAAEYQLYAGAGYAVLWVNPRGSTSYGAEFGNLIHHNYPGQDHDDLMSAVDAAIATGKVDRGQLYITGGSGGGVLTAWSIGKTNRFRAAAVAKPVINWQSFALTADSLTFFHRYWFAKPPWEDPLEYHRRSPLSLVGNVSTPTLVITGEADYRTPMSESEQYYAALKLRKVDAVLVRIPDASHDTDRRPSNLMAKIAHIVAWFDRHRSPGGGQ